MIRIHNELPGLPEVCPEVATTATCNVDAIPGQPIKCPVPICEAEVKTKSALYSHFAYRHPKATLFIQQDWLRGRCPECAMFVRNVEGHKTTKTCQRISACRANERLAEIQQSADQVLFTVNGKPIEKVRTFKYLGRTLANDDRDHHCIDINLGRARGRWRRVSQVLKREGADAQTMA